MTAASPFYNSPSTWISKYGASNHITADFTNLVVHEQNSGNDRVAVGNGAGLNIFNIGSNLISHNYFTFKLNDVLHCPSVAVSLLLVYQFTNDNNCSFVFQPDCFYVKDLKIGKS